MEHIVQFAFDFEDEAIKKKLENSAYDQIIEALKNDVRDAIFQKEGYSYSSKIQLSHQANLVLEDLLERNEEKIIDLAAQYIAAKLINRKSVKEAAIKAATEAVKNERSEED